MIFFTNGSKNKKREIQRGNWNYLLKVSESELCIKVSETVRVSCVCTNGRTSSEVIEKELT